MVLIPSMENLSYLPPMFKRPAFESEQANGSVVHVNKMLFSTFSFQIYEKQGDIYILVSSSPEMNQQHYSLAKIVDIDI